jgi:hypothetical protein
MRLAEATPDPALQSHFARMANEWTALAERGPDAEESGSVETD